MLKAITLYEPWASLISIGAKLNETRPTRTRHFGDIAIHAALKTVDRIAPEVLDAFRNRGEPMLWQFGSIIAVVEIYEVQPSSIFATPQNPYGKISLTAEELAFGNYTPGRYVYLTRNLRRLKTPVPCRGFQCVGWTVPDDVAAQVEAQL